jgi:hypothetical protein
MTQANTSPAITSTVWASTADTIANQNYRRGYWLSHTRRPISGPLVLLGKKAADRPFYRSSHGLKAMRKNRIKSSSDTEYHLKNIGEISSLNPRFVVGRFEDVRCKRAIRQSRLSFLPVDE